MAARDVLGDIRRLLLEGGAPFVEKQHDPTFTSEQSALARGEALSIGAKALVVKADDRFRLLVLPADRKLDSQAVKRLLNVKKLRFATADELFGLTGLVPGSVPPFGEPILPLELIADPALCENGRIAFNAGSLTASIMLDSSDYRRLANARWHPISQA